MQPRQLTLSENRRIFSVSQLVNDVKFKLETTFRDFWVKGEISNLRTPPSGHIYFTLKDPSAQLQAVCFRMQSRYLKFQPEDGMELLARGSVSMYPPRGQVQLIVEHLEPVGSGALQLAFEQLKKRLGKEGLFDQSEKKELPLLPARIGVVTSPTGAAVQDILKVLQRRNDRLDVLIFPVAVQGAAAAQEICAGIRFLDTKTEVDAIILARGGGSTEDLWAFNEERVARAIFQSGKPVISAVGHEIDFTIADFVADIRAATPSAAAELVSGVRKDLFNQIEHLTRRSSQAIQLIVKQKQHRLKQLTASRGFVDAETRLRIFLQRLDELSGRLSKAIPLFLVSLQTQLATQSRELARQGSLHLKSNQHRLQSATQRLEAYSPLAVLERGYAIVTTSEGTIVRDSSQVAEDDEFDIQLARGRLRAKKKGDHGI